MLPSACSGEVEKMEHRARTTEPKAFITQSLLLRFAQPCLRDRHTQRQVCLSAQQCGLKERPWRAEFRLIRSMPSPSAKVSGCLHLEAVRQAGSLGI